jgi:hypothetical protein
LTDERSDLWSVGATFYQMVTGQNPRVIEMDLVPGMIKSIISKSLKSNKSDRFQSAQEFKSELDRLKLLIQSNKTELKLLIQSIKISLKKEEYEQLLEHLDRALELDPENLDLVLLKNQTLDKLQEESENDLENLKETNVKKVLLRLVGCILLLLTFSFCVTIFLTRNKLWNKANAVDVASSLKDKKVDSAFDSKLNTGASGTEKQNGLDYSRLRPKDLLLPGNKIKDHYPNIDMKQFETLDITKEPNRETILINLRVLCMQAYCHWLIWNNSDEVKEFLYFSNPEGLAIFDHASKGKEKNSPEARVSLRNTESFDLLYFSKDLKKVTAQTSEQTLFGHDKWRFEKVDGRYKINFMRTNYHKFLAVDKVWGVIPNETKLLDQKTFEKDPKSYIGKKVGFSIWGKISADTNRDYTKITGKPAKLYDDWPGLNIPCKILVVEEMFGEEFERYYKATDQLSYEELEVYGINVSGIIQPFSKYLSENEIYKYGKSVDAASARAYFLIVDKAEFLELPEINKPFIENPLSMDDIK